MTNGRKIGRVVFRFLLLVTAGGLMGLVYYQMNMNYRHLSASHEMMERLLAEQKTLTRDFADELSLVKVDLNKTAEMASMLNDENAKLREKIELLDRMAELENSVSRLKEKNAHLINVISARKREQAPVAGQFHINADKIMSLEQGYDLLTAYREETRKVKTRIYALKREARQESIARQKAEDEEMLAQGNNGFLVKEGEVTELPGTPAYVRSQQPADGRFKIDVKFVD